MGTPLCYHSTMAYFDDSTATAKIKQLHEREEEQLLKTIAIKQGLPYVNLFETEIDTDALKLIPEEIAREARVAVFAANDSIVSLAVHSPNDPHVPAITQLFEKQNVSVAIHLATTSGIAHALQSYGAVKKAHTQHHGVLDVDPMLIKEFAEKIHSYDDIAERVREITSVHNVYQTSMVIAVVFGGALALGASDIHIEPEADAVRVRYRLDGVLWDICDLDFKIAKQITSRIKLIAGVKLNVKKEAQDGRFTFDVGTREVEIRTSAIPGSYGESLVMRLLDPSISNFNIENLGITGKLHEVIMNELKRPNGAIITTGPTGSGKTTALYSFLLEIHTPQIKIITLEDPVEYKLPGIVQTQITKDYSFETALRTVLRQDPDVILVGEIRDAVVAQTAMHAALTGHLVFSTLHTNSAVGAIPRLVDLGVEPGTIGSACNLILGQRLVRKICEQCKAERELIIEEHKLIQRILECSVSIHTVHEGKGCDACGGSGYKGRIGVYEALQVDGAIRDLLANNIIAERAIREAAKPQGIPTMQQDGVMKVLAGITTFDEVSRVLDLYHMG